MTRNCKELKHASAESMAELHPEDARKLGVKTGDAVRIASWRGSETFHVKVADNAREAGLTLANASQHLKVLRQARLVEAEKRGVFVTYRVADQAVDDFCGALRGLAEMRLAEGATSTTPTSTWGSDRWAAC